MSLGNIALGIIATGVVLYTAMLLIGAIALGGEAFWIGLLIIGGGGCFVAAVTVQRLQNKEDRHYSKNVKE